MAEMEKIFLDTANSKFSGDLPEDLKIYNGDSDLMRLKIQLQMLPDLIRTRNGKVVGVPPIIQVINVRTLCDIMNEVSMSKEMFSKVIKLLTIFFVIPVINIYCRTLFLCSKALEFLDEIDENEIVCFIK